MKEYIAFDCHKKYTLAERENIRSGRARQGRIEHEPGAIRTYLAACEPGTPVAVEATGNWYWIVDEIEEAGLVPRLVHPGKAKLMMGMVNKTDKLDVHGLNRLQRAGTLPTVWIPPAALRDLRELTRTRVSMARQRTRLKNRISAGLAKWGQSVTGWSDPYGVGGRAEMAKRIETLPSCARHVLRMQLAELDFVQAQIKELEEELKRLVDQTPQMQLLQTLPGVGLVLSTTIALEVGEAERFPDAEHLASYAGTTPRVHSSGGKTYYGRLRRDVNHYLKWAYSEAGNSVAVGRRHYPERHVSRRYVRVRERRGHAVAVGAVARHLAEATYYILGRHEPYREPAQRS